MSLRIISLNCWGLKYVSSNREQRIHAIGQKLLKEIDNYDVICLQEVWVESDFDYIRELLKEELIWAKYYHSGIIAGPGLAVLSRWPIVGSNLFSFTLNGRPSAFFRGDWYVGKSVASALIQHPNGSVVEIFSAHLHAPYGPGDAAYTCHRTAQAWMISQLAKTAIKAGHLVIVVGDLNSIPGSLTHRLLSEVSRLHDAWTDVHGESEENMGSLSPEEQVVKAGCTCDSTLNTYRAWLGHDQAKRLDFIFYDATTWHATEAVVVFTEKIPGIGSFSDHFAIKATLQWQPQNDEQKRIKRNLKRHLSITDRTDEVLCNLYADILDVINAYKPVSKWQKSVRLTHFWLSMATVAGLIAAQYWVIDSGRPWLGVVFALVGTLVGGTGLINGLIGLLFGKHEDRALQEFENQVKLAKEWVSPAQKA